MSDRENVITHLQIIHTWAEFARERDLQFFTPKHLEDIAQWADDAIVLMKEKEPVRCKDCKNLGYTNSHWFCKWLNRCVDEDWFCADGIRR